MSESYGRKGLDRTRRVGAKRDWEQGGRAALRLIADPRFRELTPHERLALLVAIVWHADGVGRFFTSYETWALSSGVNVKALKKLVKTAGVSRLVIKTPHAQPSGRQGSNDYAFDPALFNANTPTPSQRDLVALCSAGSKCRGSTRLTSAT